jgi:His-Xaa-Ser system radical SAM maturase HxsC
LFRRSSRHNTLLLTERCDQLCVMCSQPPKNTNDEWRFTLYEQALLLADENIMVGVSGGEPTLYKDVLLGMIERVSERRPDLRYHILSNGQHFAEGDTERLSRLHKSVSIVWGIPLYSHREATHDEIVGKEGAFRKVMANLFLLGGTNARIELRTVITALNIFDLPELAAFIAKNIPFIGDWAIMGMEPIGYAKPNWQRLFFDHSLFPRPIANALEIGRLTNIHVHLYNVPRCTMPAAYRRYCVDSISDWKKKYLAECDQCVERDICPGFFEWYSPKVAWTGIAPIRGDSVVACLP